MSCCSTCQNVTCQCSNGVNGKNIWTVTTALFVPPAPSASVQITVSSTQQLSNQGFGVGQVVYIENAGYYEVISIDSLTLMTVENLAGYGNPSPVNVAPGAKVSPGGLIGPTGPAGTPAVNGTSLLYNDNTPVSTVGIGVDLLHTYTVLANELANNGDALRIKAVITVINGSVIPYYNKFTLVNIAGTNVSGNTYTNATHGQSVIDVFISRVSATLINVTASINMFSTGAPYNMVKDQTLFSSVAVADLSLNTFAISLFGSCSNAGDTLTSEYLTVEKFVI